MYNRSTYRRPAAGRAIRSLRPGDAKAPRRSSKRQRDSAATRLSRRRPARGRVWRQATRAERLGATGDSNEGGGRQRQRATMPRTYGENGGEGRR
ncbi:hypothetical protein GUJ93_ZPchr0006g41074 [Zizania palustris]|uniref:Uncharacterized protein n=1 Tax=Zizania palustris TaxID=103762 RepID=A0A8J5VLU1_ZIZPA|nr:hypothetical protein GUJ93_ZPchr0006g41074 [Zizania palustris]